MRRCLEVALIVTLFLLPSCTSPTAWWLQGEKLVRADESITPSIAPGVTVDQYEPDDTTRTARPLRMGAPPQDHVVSGGDTDWFWMANSDGPGYIVVGANRDLVFEIGDAAGFELPGINGTGGPLHGADLVESTMASCTGRRGWPKDHKVLVRVTTTNKKAVAYRLSLVRQPPAR